MTTQESIVKLGQLYEEGVVLKLEAENEQLRGSPVLTEEGIALLKNLFNERWRKRFDDLEVELEVARRAICWVRENKGRGRVLHKSPCAMWDYHQIEGYYLTGKPCSCGFEAIWAAALDGLQ